MRHGALIALCSPLPQEGTHWGGATAVAVVCGQAADGRRYLKSSSLHLWLLAYEFTGGRRRRLRETPCRPM